MSVEFACSKCKNLMQAIASEIGRKKSCPQCGTSNEVPVPDIVTNDFKFYEEKSRIAQEEYERSWGNHNHIEDPKPLENFNQFFEQIRAYAISKGRTDIADFLKVARISSIPPTEHYYETRNVLRELKVKDLSIFPKNVQDALIIIKKRLEEITKS